jgi:hydrogenase nickel incorporation protein HypB
VCATCGCSDYVHATLTDLDSGRQSAIGGHDHHHHEHGHEHHAHAEAHAHAHAHRHATTVALEQAVLAKNDRLAERNRGWFEGRGILALNLMSSPGAGKTTLLERTIHALGGEVPISVIEGDQETVADALRIRATGCRVVQVNTGTGCHLDAAMVEGALRQLAPPPDSVVMIENVGNLVCPALFDLGERTKVVILSVTEGDDKPQKYPHMFRAADLMILNKIDLLPHVEFDVERCIGFARQINPGLACLRLSATTGDGLDAWCGWLRRPRSPLAAPDRGARAGL